MTPPRDFDDAPPPSPALVREVENGRPVRTRVPWQAFAGVTAVSLVYPLYSDLTEGFRRDLALLPRPWLVSVGVGWVAAFGFAAGRALLPPRGQVLPDARRAGHAAFLVVAGSALVSALFPAPPTPESFSEGPGWAGFIGPFRHCVSWGLQVSTILLAAGVFALRRVLRFGGARLGAALGAAGGSLAGLDLHFSCAYGSALHVTLAHAGSVLFGAALGAAVLGFLGRSRS